jgi:hypothetical protein
MTNHLTDLDIQLADLICLVYEKGHPITGVVHDGGVHHGGNGCEWLRGHGH